MAGLLYFIAVFVGLFGLEYLPDRFIVSGDPAATAHNILNNEMLFRVLAFSDIALGAGWLFVVLALYRLLKDVDETQAGLMMIFGAYMQVPIYFVNCANYMGAFLLVAGGTAFASFSESQRDAAAMLFLRLHHYELFASLFFAGLWLFPLAILIWKSGFLPRFLSVWLTLDGFSWLAICCAGFLAPQYLDQINRITAPFTAGELALSIWLLLLGARTFAIRRFAI